MIDLTGHRPIHVFGPLIALSESVALRLDSSLSCLSARYEVDGLRDALTASQTDCRGIAADAREQCFLFWRTTDGVMVKRVSRSSYVFASGLLAGHGCKETLAEMLLAPTDDEPIALIRSELLGTSFCQMVVPQMEGS
jgi:hypothetical protein